jgi:hypothetical protein
MLRYLADGRNDGKGRASPAAAAPAATRRDPSGGDEFHALVARTRPYPHPNTAGGLMAPRDSLGLIKRGILLFWALYFLLVLSSNLVDGLIAAGLVSEGFAFASGNYALIEIVTSRYGVADGINAILFLGVLVWEALAAALFSRASLQFPAEAGRRDARLAFGVGLALWAVFILVDELFIAYHIAGLESTHVSLLSAQFITLLALELLPSEEAARSSGRYDGPRTSK